MRWLIKHAFERAAAKANNRAIKREQSIAKSEAEQQRFLADWLILLDNTVVPALEQIGELLQPSGWNVKIDRFDEPGEISVMISLFNPTRASAMTVKFAAHRSIPFIFVDSDRMLQKPRIDRAPIYLNDITKDFVQQQVLISFQKFAKQFHP
jgi:hypothetical protein